VSCDVAPGNQTHHVSNFVLEKRNQLVGVDSQDLDNVEVKVHVTTNADSSSALNMVKYTPEQAQAVVLPE
jgi:hypothetical protein